ncbi:NfrA family protein [Cupriavidus basilensis]|uniref:NfrA family protein n=1 Tax=Cupriavidus sp. TaxID=1873897 RepID=UPI000446AD14
MNHSRRSTFFRPGRSALILATPLLMTISVGANAQATADPSGQPQDPAASSMDSQAYRLAERAYKLAETEDIDGARKAVEASLALEPNNRDRESLRLNLLVRANLLGEARTYAEFLLQKYPDDPRIHAQRAFLAQRQQEFTLASEQFAEALRLGGWNSTEVRNLRLAWADSEMSAGRPRQALEAVQPLASQKEFAGDSEVQSRVEQAKRAIEAEQNRSQAPNKLDQAYEQMRQHDDKQALELFQGSFAAGYGNAGNLADAAYAAKRLGDNKTAIDLFKRSLAAGEGDVSFDPERRFGYRREVETLQRQWGFVLSAPYQASGFNPQSNVENLQTGIEAYWQPPDIGYRDGRIFQVFTRAYGTAYDGKDGPTGMPTVQGAVGARYKPVRDMNLVFTTERLFRIGHLSTDDWLMRIGYSNDRGIDLKPVGAPWKTWQIYTEGAYFLQAGRFILSGELRYGQSRRLESVSERMVFYPHLVLAGDHDNKALTQTALGIGPGIAFRYWFRETRDSAPASWLDVSIQYRFRLTSAERAEGLVTRLILWF